MPNDFILGTLRPRGYLKTDSGDVFLTKISMQASQSPESGALEVASEDQGKMAFVRGHLSGGVLYSAQIVEICSPLAGNLIKTLIDKDLVSPEEIREQASAIADQGAGEQEKKKLCALVIGHKKRSPGARNANSNLTEFDFNEDLALRIENKVQDVEIQRVYRRTYEELPDDVNALNPDYIVSLHCNAFDTEVSGSEVLYYHKSQKGKEIAEALLNDLVAFLKLNNRGTKPKSTEDRGGYLLRYTKAPCVIAEPFFIDNDKDLARAQENLDGLAAAYAKAIDGLSEVVSF